MDIFLIETPHQLLNAIEAKVFLGIELAVLVIIALPEYPPSRYFDLFARYPWDPRVVVDVSECGPTFVTETLAKCKSERVRNYWSTYKTRVLRKRLDAIAKKLGSCRRLVIGNYYSSHMLHFANRIMHKELYLLDDGTATLGAVRIRAERNYVQRRRKIGIRQSLIDKFLGFQINEPRQVIFFSTYEFDVPPGDALIKNEYLFLSQWIRDGQSAGDVFFVGQALVENGNWPIDLYVSELRKVKQHFLGREIVYVAHPKETELTLETIRNQVGVIVRRFSVPIELEMVFGCGIPNVLASFCSSALETARVLFGDRIEIVSFYVAPEHFKKNPTVVRKIYEYFSFRKSSSFSIVEL